ncbi:MAG: hypothetical protein M3Q55_17730 [Acidobacteriota bacterium]|nr:hypothetical protein [Acidobacteriota bacterium]
MRFRLAAAMLVAAAILTGPARAAAQTADGISDLVLRLEAALAAGDAERFKATITGDDPAETAQFAALMRGARSHAVVRERDRNPGDTADTAALLFDTFVQRGQEGQLTTWSANAARESGVWRFTSLRQLASVDGLYRLSLGAKQFAVRNLTLTSTDFTLRMASGAAFIAEAAGGTTAIVLRGKGELLFTPSDEAERAQLRIFDGEPVLRAGFTEAFVRLHPSELASRTNAGSLVERALDAGDHQRAQQYFDASVNKTYSLDLQDLSRDRWSLIPAAGDLVAEVRTGKFGDLTYALSSGESEDISLFHRASRRNISVYASQAQLAGRGRFYSEDDLSDYDILDHDIDVRMTPEREWIEGTARVRARVRALSMSTMRLRLAESLVVRSVISKEHGRLMHLRVIGQNNVIVTLPRAVSRDDTIELEVRYGGRLAAQLPDREVAAVSADQDFEPITIPPEPRWIYSNRSYWYPQSTVTDFATSRLRITVPEPFDVLATGVQNGSPVSAPAAPDAGLARTFTFESGKPARYLSCIISRFTQVVSTSVGGGAPATLNVVASPRQAARARATGEQAERIFSFYRTLLGSAPYPQLTVAVSESDLPGGHSPAYFVIVNQILPTANVTWRSDPVSFDNYPSFFLAHEIAHQWWGQAVGWKNYHEQWISEGFAQYLAALYAGEQGGPRSLANVMRQMRRWALEHTDAGPVYLGYRLGHIENDSRVFRAVVYNKSAVVLHMLRRIVGDEPFFAGMRHFYEQSTFAKAGTEDFRRVMEAETGRNLERFFERWIYGFAVPEVKVTHRVEEAPDGTSVVVVRAEQKGPVYDLPITIGIEQANGTVRQAVLVLSEATGELRVPVEGRVRRVLVDSDAAALARFLR